MLVNGDKLVVKKRVASFLNEGDIVKVVEVKDNGVISFAFGKNFEHMCLMSPNECEEYFEKIEEKKVSAPTVTEEWIEEILDNSEFDAYTVFGKCTVVSCRLPNGFVITESSACVSHENYDEKIGFEICLEKITDKLWELEGYRLQEELYRANAAMSDCEDCFCDECPCVERYDEECLYTDLDCDDCDNYSCPHNSKN